tara:strand:+ start:568 stop:1314 length:747 start_codon:yes stop_codon:yes gene_type:complete
MSTSFEKSKAASLLKIRERARLYELIHSQNRIMNRNRLFREQLLAKVWRNRDTPMSRYANAEKRKDLAIAKLLKTSREKAERKKKLEVKKNIEKKISDIRKLMKHPHTGLEKKRNFFAKIRSLEKTIPKFYLPNGACEECKRKPCECSTKLRFRSRYPYISADEAKVYLVFVVTGFKIRKLRLKSTILIQRVVRGRQDRLYVDLMRKMLRRNKSQMLTINLKKEISKRENRKYNQFLKRNATETKGTI